MDGFLSWIAAVLMLAGTYLAVIVAETMRRKLASKSQKKTVIQEPRQVSHPITMASKLNEAVREGKRQIAIAETLEGSPSVDEDIDIGFGFSASFQPDFAPVENKEE